MAVSIIVSVMHGHTNIKQWSWHIGGTFLVFDWIYRRKAHKISAQLVSAVGFWKEHPPECKSEAILLEPYTNKCYGNGSPGQQLDINALPFWPINVFHISHVEPTGFCRISYFFRKHFWLNVPTVMTMKILYSGMCCAVLSSASNLPVFPSNFPPLCLTKTIFTCVYTIYISSFTCHSEL